MTRIRLYRLLMGSLGIASFLFGIAMIATFFLYQRPGSTPLVPTGPIGHYFIALAGCALIGWAGGLIGAARDPMGSRTVGTLTIVVLVVMALIRMIAWVIGDYASWLGSAMRTEALGMLIVALLLVWLKPTVRESRARDALAAAGVAAVHEIEGSEG